MAHTLGLWRHVTKPVYFTLVVDDFGVKYVGRENAEHLMRTIRKTGYELTEYWAGALYCGITLDWHYEEGYVEISIPYYIERVLQRFKHEMLKKSQDCLYTPPQRIYGTTLQKPVLEDTSKQVDAPWIRVVQQVVGCVLCYLQAVDCTVLVTLSSIVNEHTSATESTEKKG